MQAYAFLKKAKKRIVSCDLSVLLCLVELFTFIHIVINASFKHNTAAVKTVVMKHGLYHFKEPMFCVILNTNQALSAFSPTDFSFPECDLKGTGFWNKFVLCS